MTVQVADGKDAAGDTESPAVIDDTIAVTIDLTNVNEPPEITSTGTSHTEPSFAEIEFDIADADLSATAKDSPSTARASTVRIGRDRGDGVCVWRLGQ